MISNSGNQRIKDLTDDKIVVIGTIDRIKRKGNENNENEQIDKFLINQFLSYCGNKMEIALNMCHIYETFDNKL